MPRPGGGSTSLRGNGIGPCPKYGSRGRARGGRFPMMGNTSMVGALLREWRGVRRMSQLDLAVAAEVSPRHLSFVETGRAVPSREMVLTLARALDVPFRERNTMLTAAGYATVYRATSLDHVRMVQLRSALQLLLRQHEPFIAVAFDRHW